jgi:hypothetical protein
VGQQLARDDAESRAPRSGDCFRAEHQQRRGVVLERKKNALADDAGLHPRMHSNALPAHFGFDACHLLMRGNIVIHGRRCAARECVADRIDDVHQQQHGVLMPGDRLRAAEGRGGLFSKIGGRHNRPERERPDAAQITNFPMTGCGMAGNTHNQPSLSADWAGYDATPG